MTVAGGRDHVSTASVWTLAVETMAKASAVAAAATGEEELRQRTAAARCAARPHVRFVELGFLCHIAELAGVAAKRLRLG
jgi:hypothetical protein